MADDTDTEERGNEDISEQDPGAEIDRENDEPIANPDGSPLVQQQQALPTTPAAPAPAKLPGQQYSPHDIPPQGTKSFAVDIPGMAAAGGKGVSLKDYAKSTYASLLETGESLVGAASLAARKITGNPELVTHIEQGRHFLADQAAGVISSMSPDAQQAIRASLFGSSTDEQGNHVPSPGEVGWARYAGMRVAQFIPDAAMLLLPGGIAAKATEKLIGVAAKEATRTGVTAATMGASQAGQAYNTLVDEVDKAPDREMMQNPAYAHLRQQGMSAVDAKRSIVEQLATPFAAAQFAVGAITGAGAGRLLTKGALGAEGASLGRRAGIGAAEGAGTLGFQGAAGNALQQQAAVQAGTQKEFDPHQTAAAFASGALGGALLGAAGGAFHRAETPLTRATEESATEVRPPATHDSMQPEQSAALTEALPGQRTPNQWTSTGNGAYPVPERAGPGQVPGQLALPAPQGKGEGFTMSPPGTPAVPTDRQLPAPEQRPALPPPNAAAQGAQGAGFTMRPQGVTPEPAKPSGGLNRGNLITELTQLGQDRQALARMKISDLRDAYDQAKAPPEPVSQQFRPIAEPITGDHPIDKAAAKAETTPSDAQKEAGNYQKGHIALQGLDVSIETPKGGIRQGPLDKTTNKPAWEAKMPAHYGYIKGTVGGDGEHVDVQLGPRTKAMFDGKPSEAAGEPVFVVDQIDPKTGKFDEHKALIGFHTSIEAARAYDEAFTDGSGPSRRGAVTEMPFDKFKEWLRGDTTRAVAYKKLTVGEQLVKRAAQKQRMAAPEATAALLTKSQARASFAREAGEEARGQPQVFEPPEGARTTVVEEGAAERQRSPQTTNLDRKLSDLESKVSNGLMTAAEADKEYGTKTVSTGRARTYPDFESWLKARIERAEDPKVQDELLAKAEALQKMPGGARRNAAARSINEELQRTGKDYADKLRQMVEDLRDPVKSAADEAERLSKKNSALDRIKALNAAKKARDDIAGMERTGAGALFHDERINRPLREIIDDMRSAPVHEYLDRIANDPVIRTRLPQAVALARWFKGVLPSDIEVLPNFLAAAIHPERSDHYMNERAAGMFDPRHDVIVLNPAAKEASAVEVILHESMHAVTTRYLRENPTRSHAVLDAIGDEMLSNRSSDLVLSDREKGELTYALSNNEELHTMLMTSPTLQEVAASITPSQEFRTKMRELGYAPQESKSLWSAFTGWVRRSLNIPSTVGDSLLDHVLKPLQDIADRAVKFNRGELKFVDELPAELRSVAEPAINAMPRFGEAAERAKDKIDVRGLGAKGTRAVLQAFTTDSIVKRYRELFRNEEGVNILEKYREAAEGQAAVSKDFRDKWNDTVHDLIGRTAKLPAGERDKLAVIMSDPDTGKVKLGTTATDANAHLTTADQQTMLRDMQGKYNALSPEAKRLYNNLRDYYRETHDIEREAELSAMIKQAIPDATPEQAEALSKAAKTMRGIKQLIDDPDASPAAAAFADAWDRNRSLARGIAKVHSQGWVEGDYFPLRRYGDWVIHYGTKGTEDYGVERFEKISDAQHRRDELVKQGVEPSDVLDLRKTYLRDAIPHTTVMDELAAAIRKSTGSEAQANSVRDLFASVMMQRANRSEAAKSRMRRQGVKGASHDFEKILARDYLSLSSRMGYLERGVDRTNVLGEMRRHVDLLGRTRDDGSQIRASAVTHELEQRQPVGDDDSRHLYGLARRAGQLGYTYSLMSPSHMLTSTGEAHTNSIAMMGSRHGTARATLALARALKDTAPVLKLGAKNTVKAVRQGMVAADWNISYALRDRLIAGGANRAHMNSLFNGLNNAGLIDHSMVRELQRIANPTGLYKTRAGDWWGRFMDMNGAMAHAVDGVNKSAIAKAAFDLELRRTGDAKAAEKYAIDTARDAMPNYNLANKARITTPQGALGPLAGPLTQFKNYGLHMYSVMGALIHDSMNGVTAAEKMEARKALAGLFVTHALTAGVLTWVADPLRYVMGAYDWITGAAKPHDYQNDVRSWIKDAMGPELGEVFSRGLPHLAGVDVHRRIGIANLLEIPELKEFSAKGFGEMLMTAMLGASGEDSVQMFGAMSKFSQDGDPIKLVKGLAPRVVRDPIKAAQLSEKGVTDSKGKTILPASRLSAGDIAAQAVGFQPARVSEFREQHNAILEAREEVKFERGKVMTAFTSAAPADRAGVIEKIREYNRANPTQPITYSELLQAQKRQAEMVRTPASAGLLLPKHAARTLSQKGSFANVQ